MRCHELMQQKNYRWNLEHVFLAPIKQRRNMWGKESWIWLWTLSSSVGWWRCCTWKCFLRIRLMFFFLTSLVTHVRSEAGSSPWAPNPWWWFSDFLGGIPDPKVLKLKQITQILLLLYEIGPWFLVIIIWNKLLSYCCCRDRWSWYTSGIWCIRKAPCEILLWTWPPLLVLLLLAVCELFSLLDVFRTSNGEM